MYIDRTDTIIMNLYGASSRFEVGSTTLSEKMKQTDQAFIAACGLADDPEASQAAISLRKELAAYGRMEDRRLEADSLCANMTIIETGILHPADSIDLIDFTLHLESMTGVDLDAEDVKPLIAAGSEEMELRVWIQHVLDLKERKQGHNKSMDCTSQ